MLLKGICQALLLMLNDVVEFVRRGSRRHDGFKEIPIDELERDPGSRLVMFASMHDPHPRFRFPNPVTDHGTHACKVLQLQVQTSSTSSSGVHDTAGGRWQPEEKASRFSRWFFNFCEGLLSIGSRKVLAADDLWDLTR